MKRILVLTQWFFPAHKADDFITPCNNIINELSPQHCFYVLTSNRDMGDKTPLKGIATNEWINLINKSVVRYVPEKNMTATNLRQIIRKINPHAIYINTMLSLRYSLMPLHVLNKTGYTGKIIIAPGGLLNQNRIGYNALKKRCFAFLLSRFRSKATISFLAANEKEASLIKKYFGHSKPVQTADQKYGELFFPSLPGKTPKKSSREGAVIMIK